MTVKQLKRGDFFTLKDIEFPKESQVYIRGDYDRASKKYICYKFSDVCSTREIKGNKEIYTGFTF